MFKWQHPFLLYSRAETDQFIEALEDRQSRLELKKLMQDMISNFPQYRVAWEIDDSIGLEPK